jgi:purine-binding chemotaxis protein CheW
VNGPLRQLCTVRIGGRWYGVPVDRVQEVLRHSGMTPVPLAPALVAGLINLRGQIVEALDPRVSLEMPGAGGDLPSVNVVLRTPAGPVSLLAEDVGDVIEVREESAEPSPSTVGASVRRLISVTCKLSDGLLPVLDVDLVISAFPERRA